MDDKICGIEGCSEKSNRIVHVLVSQLTNPSPFADMPAEGVVLVCDRHYRALYMEGT